MKRYITIIDLDGSERELSDYRLPLIIGSGPHAHIRTEGPDREAAFIGENKGHLFIQPNEKVQSPVFHNNRHLVSSAWLKSKDVIRIGNNLIGYAVSGDHIRISISPAARNELRPPLEPPPETEKENNVPVNVSRGTSSSTLKRILRAILALSLLVLGSGVYFVLAANTLEISVQPKPDHIEVSGFPPAIPVGNYYLCLPGTYRITVEKSGYLTFREQHTISKEGNSRLEVELEKLPGLLALLTKPADGVTVYVNDREIDTTPPHTFKIPAGRQRIKLTKDRYQPFLTELDVLGENKTQNLKAELQPDWAEISFRSKPPGAELLENDTILGKTPLTVELLSGNRHITFRRENFLTKEMDISVRAGKNTTYIAEMTPLPGRLSLTSTPDKASVLVDQEYKGTTPLSLDLTPDTEHQIVIKARDYKETSVTMMLKPGERKAETFILDQQFGDVYLTIFPPNAELKINGRSRPVTQGKLTLPVSTQTLVVSADGYKTATRKVTPKTGFSQQLTIELEPADNTEPEQIITTGAGQKLLLVVPAPFTMGAPRREPGRRANEHLREVAMQRPFYLSEKVVTNRDYRRYRAEHNSGSVTGYSLNADEQPVVNLSWEDAVHYLNWLSKNDKLPPFYLPDGETFRAVEPPNNGYRLPSEAEWAFSARQVGSPVVQRFPWSGGFPPTSPTGNYADEAARSILANILVGYYDRFPVTSPVGSFPPNRAGFYDMGGNVAEWCHDYYAAYLPAAPLQQDPLGPVSGVHRVVRGSSWRDASITELRLSYRGYLRSSRDNVGFRIARYK